MRRDSVERSWLFIESILQFWHNSSTRWLPEYAAGSWGPVEADRMIEADAHKWRLL
jgi:glucose-6-phosphate 1-dehydrogenase